MSVFLKQVTLLSPNLQSLTLKRSKLRRKRETGHFVWPVFDLICVTCRWCGVTSCETHACPFAHALGTPGAGASSVGQIRLQVTDVRISA